jgi:hypothetical protein
MSHRFFWHAALLLATPLVAVSGPILYGGNGGIRHLSMMEHW